MFEADIEEQDVQYCSFDGHKMPLNTCNTLKQAHSIMSPNFNSLSSFSDQLDLSLDLQLNHHNASLIKEAILSYLRQCLQGLLPEHDPLSNGQLFTFPSYSNLDNEPGSQLDALVHKNPILNEGIKNKLVKNFKEFHELNGLFSQLTEKIGLGLSQQLVLVLMLILEKKLPHFKQLAANKQDDSLLPRFDRFWGDQDKEKSLENEITIYGEFDWEEIRNFAAKDVEKIAESIFFSNQLKYLTLKEINGQSKPDIKIVEKFATLVIHLSCTFFFTMAGMAQPEGDHKNLTKELSFHLSEQHSVEFSSSNKKVKL